MTEPPRPPRKGTIPHPAPPPPPPPPKGARAEGDPETIPPEGGGDDAALEWAPRTGCVDTTD